MAADLMAFVLRAKSEFPFNIDLILTTSGAVETVTLPVGTIRLELPVGNNASVSTVEVSGHKAFFILLNKDANAITQFMGVMHEFGHLFSDLNGRNPIRRQREFEAMEWVLDRLISEGVPELATTYLQGIKQKRDAGTWDWDHSDAAQEILADPKWQSYLKAAN